VSQRVLRKRALARSHKQGGHQRPYKTRKGRYWVERWSQWEGVRPTAEWLSERDAARWLLANDHDLPEELAHFEREICE
jgi:hypothetical protein